MRGRERPVAPATTARRCTTLDRSPGWTERSCVRVRAYAVSLRCVSVSLPTRVRIFIYISIIVVRGLLSCSHEPTHVQKCMVGAHDRTLLLSPLVSKETCPSSLHMHRMLMACEKRDRCRLLRKAGRGFMSQLNRYIVAN